MTKQNLSDKTDPSLDLDYPTKIFGYDISDLSNGVVIFVWAVGSVLSEKSFLEKTDLSIVVDPYPYSILIYV